MGKESNKTATKKDLRREVALQLEKNLGHLKELLGDKKFSNRVKKAARILTEGALTQAKKEAREKPQPEKAAKPAPVKASSKTPEAPLERARKSAPVKKKPVTRVTKA